MALNLYCGILMAISFAVLCKGNVRRDRLTVTFGKFSPLPLTARQAVQEGWKGDANCRNGPSANFFRGNRYVRYDDNTTKILYDCWGRVAGIQTTIEPTSDFPTQYNYGPWHRNADGTITATAYFRNPNRICSCRCHSKKAPPVGDRLWIQLGDITGRKSTNKFMVVPLNKKKIANTPWVEGKCVSAMGVHYHYNISKDFDCNYAFPVFLIANKYNGDVHGFGWGVPVVVNSPRWEHPAPELFARSIKEENIPSCILKYKAVSVQHIYFVDPLKITCF
ncbi:uncharacterized protein LOC116296384 [Actinia tenebrosa]|uniref:Uncharacterized protein LOC116296384 n=1 Tax=Actinia tenebrosa TaxID=6105 RepID=A0A6P8HV12_ACTTE|nr:uncharacterized protein LOC116296384 [Actinia tenebrosa]